MNASGPDRGDDARESELRELEALVALTQERTSRALDARVSRSIGLAEGIAGAVADLEVDPSRRVISWRFGAIAAAVLIVFALAVRPAGRELGWFAPEDAKQDVATRPTRSPTNVPGPAPAAPDDMPAGTGRRLDESRPRAPTPTSEPSGELAPHQGDPLAASAPTQSRRRPDGTIVVGPPASLDAHESARAVDAIARMRIGPSGLSPNEDSRDVEILRVYQGDPVLAGMRIELQRGTDLARRSFLGWDGDADSTVVDRPTEFVACLEELHGERSRSGARVFRLALTVMWSVTLVSSELPDGPRPMSTQESLEALASDLAASLMDPAREVRRSAILALRRFEEPKSRRDPAAIGLWRNPATSRALLAATRDPDASVRWNVALMGPDEEGAEGIAALREMVFDPVPLTRRSAELKLPPRRSHEIVVPLADLHDAAIELRWSRRVVPPSIKVTSMKDAIDSVEIARDHADPSVRLERLEALRRWTNERSDFEDRYLEAIVTAIQDRDVDVRIAAAEAAVDFERGPKSDLVLDSASDDSDARVVAMAATSRVLLGDPKGIPALRDLLVGSDPRAAAQAVERLVRGGFGPTETRDEAVAICFDGLGFHHEAVRARTLPILALASAWMRSAEVERLRRAIVDARSDPSPLVRLATDVAERILGEVEVLSPEAKRWARITQDIEDIEFTRREFEEARDR